MKYSKEIAKKFVELYATGNHSISQICAAVGIHVDTYYDWRQKKSEFSEALKSAEIRRLDAIKDLAKTGLALLLTGHEWEETKTEFVESKDKTGKSVPKIKSQTKIKKFVMPNPTMVIFTLTNQDPDNWKQRQQIAHTGADDGPIEQEVTVQIGYGKKGVEDDETEGD